MGEKLYPILSSVGQLTVFCVEFAVIVVRCTCEAREKCGNDYISPSTGGDVRQKYKSEGSSFYNIWIPHHLYHITPPIQDY